MNKEIINNVYNGHNELDKSCFECKSSKSTLTTLDCCIHQLCKKCYSDLNIKEKKCFRCNIDVVIKKDLCRYDLSQITPLNVGPCAEICKNVECLNLYKFSCKKLLKCNHLCYGTIGELKCSPCLQKKCENYQNIFNQDQDSNCIICLEKLTTGPLILLDCKHYFHRQCLLLRLISRWNGNRITFSHVFCSLCNVWIKCSNNPDIQCLVDRELLIYNKVIENSLNRFELEGLHTEEAFNNPTGDFYHKKVDFAFYKFSYYLCYKCDNPYFTGLIDCQFGANVDEELDKSKLLCSECSDLSGIEGITECEYHGREYILYKCRFCCKFSKFFCFGTTHFCGNCH